MRNAHDIAIELEYMLRKEFGFENRPRGTIFDADAIESYMFYDILHLLLYKKSNQDWCDFINKIFQYKGVSMNKIPGYEQIFEEFKLLLV